MNDTQKTREVLNTEIKYVAECVCIMSALALIVLVILGRPFLFTLLGIVLSSVVVIGNFMFTALTVERALSISDPSRASKIMVISYLIRMAILAFLIYIGIITEYIDLWGIIIPLFFPKIAITARPFVSKLLLRKEGETWKARK